VNCDKLAEAIGFQTQWTVRKGVEDLHRAFVERGLTQETFSTYFRLTRIVEQLRGSELDSMLRWRTAPVAA
jgi:hypothetical protein